MVRKLAHPDMTLAVYRGHEALTNKLACLLKAQAIEPCHEKTNSVGLEPVWHKQNFTSTEDG